jgi:hypothetical protein
VNVRWMLATIALVTAFLVTMSGCVGEGAPEWGLHERRLSREEGMLEPPHGDWQFQLAVPIGVARTRLALAAEQSLVVGAHAAITARQAKEFATLAGLSQVSIGSGAHVGSVYGGAAAPISIGDDATVDGFVRADTSIRPSSAHFAVGVQTDVPDPGEYFRWTVQPPSEATERHLEPAADAITLPPGAYASIVIDAGSDVVLGAGQYFFQSLEIGEGTLRIEDTAGPVYVWVQRLLQLTGVPRCASGEKFMLGYHGNSDVTVPAGFCGTLVAPFAALQLTGTQAPYVGAFFARSIDVADDVVIEHRPFKLPGW